MKTILLKFAGPLQSYGTSSHFETRQTDRYPSKSAVIGLVAGALGYRRDYDAGIQLLLDNLDFAVRVDQPGVLLRDYHIATKYKKDGQFERTYVTNRYYLQDAVFVVALGGDNEKLISDIEQALRSPYFQPFLGRRSLPVTYDFYVGMTDEGVVQSLEDLEWQASVRRKKKNHNESVKLDLYVDAELLKTNQSFLARDRVISFSQRNRQFGFRSVATKKVEVKNDCFKPQSEHDALAALDG